MGKKNYYLTIPLCIFLKNICHDIIKKKEKYILIQDKNKGSMCLFMTNALTGPHLVIRGLCPAKIHDALAKWSINLVGLN